MIVRHVEDLGYHNRYLSGRAVQFVLQHEQPSVEGPVPKPVADALLRELDAIGVPGWTEGTPLDRLLDAAPRDAGTLAAALTAYLMTSAFPGSWIHGALPAQGDHFSFYVETPDTSFLRSCAQSALPLVSLLLAANPEHSAQAVERARLILRDFEEGFPRAALNVYMREILAKADAQGIPWKRASQGISHVTLGQGHKRRYYNGVMCDSDSLLGYEISVNKALCQRLLATAGLPVPKFAQVYNEKTVRDAAQTIGYPVVVKPNSMGLGIGVHVGIETEEELLEAYAAAAAFEKGVLVEQMMPGDDHRLLVVDGRFIAASLRRPAQVVGDGERPLRALIEAANADPLRCSKHAALLVEIAIDADSEKQLARQGLTLDSVPAAGQAVRLKGTANIATGGTGEDVTDKVHPDNIALAENAARTIGVGVGGIDFITTDITRSFREAGGAICEVNTAVSLAPHRAANPERDVITPLLRRGFAANEDGRIPIAVASGHGRMTGIVRRLARILNGAGLVCGDTTAEEARVAGQPVTRGKLDNYRGSEILLNDPACEAAAIALDPENVAQRGLAFDRCTAVGLFGLSALEEEPRAAALRLLGAARDAVVLRADDPALPEAIEAAGGRPVVLTGGAKGDAPVSAHLKAGGAAFLVERETETGDAVVFRKGRKREVLLPASDLQRTGGASDSQVVDSALAAAALAYTLGQPLSAIAAGLARTPERARKAG